MECWTHRFHEKVYLQNLSTGIYGVSFLNCKIHSEIWGGIFLLMQISRTNIHILSSFITGSGWWRKSRPGHGAGINHVILRDYLYGSRRLPQNMTEGYATNLPPLLVLNVRSDFLVFSRIQKSVHAQISRQHSLLILNTCIQCFWTHCWDKDFVGNLSLQPWNNPTTFSDYGDLIYWSWMNSH